MLYMTNDLLIKS